MEMQVVEGRAVPFEASRYLNQDSYVVTESARRLSMMRKKNLDLEERHAQASSGMGRSDVVGHGERGLLVAAS